MWPGVLVARYTCDQVYMWPGVNERDLCSESVWAYLHRYALSKTSWHQTKNIQISTNNIVLLISCIFLSDAFKRGHFNNILEHLAHLIFEMYRGICFLEPWFNQNYFKIRFTPLLRACHKPRHKYWYIIYYGLWH